MPESADSPDDFPPETSVPGDAVPLESVLCTEELHRRPSRPPDYEKENRALITLAGALAHPRSNIFETFATKMLETMQCDSAGLSLLTKDGGKRFYWPAIAGIWKPHTGGGIQRKLCPCGDVLDRDRPLLFRHFEQRYPYLLPVLPAAEECLTVPFYFGGRAIGTIWAIMHTDRRKFDAEDERLMKTLGQFASLAYQAVESMPDRRTQIAAREKAEGMLSEHPADALDLSEQERSGEAFLTVGPQARSIIESALDAVVTMDADGFITDWNGQAENTFGWARSEALGRRASETIIPMRYRRSHEIGLRHFLGTGQGAVLNRRIEITALRRDGTEFPVELTVTPLKSGDRWTFFSFVRDISERRRAEEKLRESELNLRQMTETIPEMLWSASPDGAIDYFNARVLDYTGFSVQELRGSGWQKYTHPEDARQVFPVWTSCIATGTPYRAEVRIFHAADRTYRWCVTSAVPLLDQEGRILKWYGTIVDMQDWKQAQEELRNAQAEIAHMNRVMTMGELAASIAHEVNQPLASIIASGDSYAAWMANEPPNLDKARTAVGRMMQAATQASEIVQRLRALFKKTPPAIALVDINAVIEDTVPLVHHAVERHNIVLRTDLDRGVSAVSGDRVQLQQVILNLAMNGIESIAGLANEPRRLLIQSRLSSPGELLVSVEDTGAGIDVSNADPLFAPFFTTKPLGIGMGLPICRSIIEAHGGRLWAATSEPRGAAFRFILPCGEHRE
jgi:PAS domain S-box-containing protein